MKRVIFNRGQIVSKYGITCLIHRRRKRGPGGPSPPQQFERGGDNIPFGPPNNPPTFSFNFDVKQEKITNVPS